MNAGFSDGDQLHRPIMIADGADLNHLIIRHDIASL